MNEKDAAKKAHDVIAEAFKGDTDGEKALADLDRYSGTLRRENAALKEKLKTAEEALAAHRKSGTDNQKEVTTLKAANTKLATDLQKSQRELAEARAVSAGWERVQELNHERRYTDFLVKVEHPVAESDDFFAAVWTRMSRQNLRDLRGEGPINILRAIRTLLKEPAPRPASKEKCVEIRKALHDMYEGLADIQNRLVGMDFAITDLLNLPTDHVYYQTKERNVSAASRFYLDLGRLSSALASIARLNANKAALGLLSRQPVWFAAGAPPISKMTGVQACITLATELRCLSVIGNGLLAGLVSPRSGTRLDDWHMTDEYAVVYKAVRQERNELRTICTETPKKKGR
jgi:hypothetical protein